MKLLSPLLGLHQAPKTDWKLFTKIIGETLVMLFCHASQLNILKIFTIFIKIHCEKSVSISYNTGAEEQGASSSWQI